jgi:hypothetical protein
MEGRLKENGMGRTWVWMESTITPHWMCSSSASRQAPGTGMDRFVV